MYIIFFNPKMVRADYVRYASLYAMATINTVTSLSSLFLSLLCLLLSQKVFTFTKQKQFFLNQIIWMANIFGGQNLWG